MVGLFSSESNIRSCQVDRDEVARKSDLSGCVFCCPMIFARRSFLIVNRKRIWYKLQNDGLAKNMESAFSVIIVLLCVK